MNQHLETIRRVSLYLDLIDHYMSVGLFNLALDYIQRTNKIIHKGVD